MEHRTDGVAAAHSSSVCCLVRDNGVVVAVESGDNSFGSHVAYFGKMV